MRTPEEILAAREDEPFERAIYDVRAMNDRVLLRRMRAAARDLAADWHKNQQRPGSLLPR